MRPYFMFSVIGLASFGLFAEFTQGSPPSGTIVGRVIFSGTVPEPIAIMVSDGSTIKHSDLVVDAKTKGLRDVMVMLEDAPVQPKALATKPVVMDQFEWVFKPRVVAVQYGQEVRFDNHDSVNHSVMASSIVQANQFNRVAGSGTPIVHAFAPQKAPVLIGCSLHPWMRAWVYVVQHPWFAVSDDHGEFRIEKVPPGKYVFLLVHPDSGLRERRTVEVQSEKTVELTVDWQRIKKSG